MFFNGTYHIYKPESRRRADRQSKKGACFGIACGLGLAELIGVIVFIFIPQLVRLFDSHAAGHGLWYIAGAYWKVFYFLLAFYILQQEYSVEQADLQSQCL